MTSAKTAEPIEMPYGL